MRATPRALAVGALFGLATAGACAQAERPSAEALAAETRVQQAYAAQAFFADIDRIESVAFPLLRAAAGYCAGREQWSLGAAPRTVAQLPPTLRDAAAALGLDEQPRFMLVLPGSPLALAGVQRGDRLLGIDGQPSPSGAPAAAWFGQVASRRWISTRRPLALGLQRGGRNLDVAATPQAVCAMALRYAVSDSVNAAAGVNQLMVSSGMLRFTADDAELALVLGHELAHAVLRHPDAAKARAAAGGARRDPYSQDKERDADRLGLYLAAAAGHDIGHAAELWRRMAARAPGSIEDHFGASHPSSPERFLLLRSVAAEVAERQRRGDTLTPPLAALGLRPDSADAAPDAVTPLPLPALAQLPFLNDDGRAAYAGFIAARERPRALALSLSGHVSMRSGADAPNEAMASCNAMARGACRLVALDDAWLGAGFLPLPTAAPASAAQ